MDGYTLKGMWIGEIDEMPEDVLRELVLINNRLIASTGISPRTAHRYTSTGTLLCAVENEVVLDKGNDNE